LALLSGAGVAPAQNAPTPAEVGPAVDAAVATLERELAAGKRRVAILPVRASEKDQALARAVADRIVTRLRAAGAEVLDPSFYEVLREAERQRPNGPLNVSAVRLVSACLSVDAVVAGELKVDAFVSGEVHRAEEGGGDLTLRLIDARDRSDAKILANACTRFLAPKEVPAAAEPAAGHPDAPADVKVRRRVFVERHLAGGAYAPPESWDEKPLEKGDRMMFYVRPLTSGYLCVIAHLSDGSMRRLFPPDAEATVESARVEADRAVRLPAEENKWWPLVDPVGTDTYFVVAEREPRMMARLVKITTGHAAAAAAAPAPAGAAPGKPAPEDPPLADGAAKTGYKVAEAAAEEAEEIREKRRLRAERMAGGVRREPTDVEDALLAEATSFREEFRLRQVFRSIRAGDPLPDAARLRMIVDPVDGGPAPGLSGEGGQPLTLKQVEGVLHVVESFSIVSVEPAPKPAPPAK
jgi:hypothetical protein